MPIGNCLKGIHNVSITTIKGQVVPSPVEPISRKNIGSKTNVNLSYGLEPADLRSQGSCDLSAK